MSELVAVVTVTQTEGAHAKDREIRVRNLEDLYEACKGAPPSHLVRVSLRGPQGEVLLNFASFITGGAER